MMSPHLSIVAVCAMLTCVSGGGVSMGGGNEIVAEWNIVGGENVTIQMTCTPGKHHNDDDGVNKHSRDNDLSWCSFGINTEGTSKMSPAAVWWMSVSSAGVPLGIEDRMITHKEEPPCAPTQLSYLLSSNYDATTKVLFANFTRRLNVTPAEAREGYSTISDKSVSLIGAIGGGLKATLRCGMGSEMHYGAYGNIKANFFH